MAFTTIDELERGLREAEYLPDRGLATALFLSLRLEKPVLLEGEAGGGKTEAAKAFAAWFLRAPELAPPRVAETERAQKARRGSRDESEPADAGSAPEDHPAGW